MDPLIVLGFLPYHGVCFLCARFIVKRSQNEEGIDIGEDMVHVTVRVTYSPWQSLNHADSAKDRHETQPNGPRRPPGVRS
jgi:hypothetical protein